MTVTQIIDVAKISQYLCLVDIQKKGIFGGGVDVLLPQKLYNIRKSVEYWYNLDPTEETLIATSNYLLALCGAYALEAAVISGAGGGGSVSPVTPPSTPTPYDFEVDGSSSFMVDGEASKTITSFIGRNIIFVRGGITQSEVNIGGSYFDWNSATGLFQCFPAATMGELFQIYPL